MEVKKAGDREQGTGNSEQNRRRSGGGMSLKINEVDTERECYARARARQQETFTLVAQDRTSPRTILYWIGENFETAPPEKLREAFERALRMREFPERKWAD